MIMGYSVFSFKRYWFLLRKNVVEDWRRQAMLTGINVLVVIMAVAFFGFVMDGIDGMDTSERVTMVSFFAKMTTCGLFMFMLCYQTAHSMPFMATKVKQTGYMMLPTTGAERYAVAVTLSLVVTVIECVAAFFVADLLMSVFYGELLIFANNGEMDMLHMMVDGITWDYAGLVTNGVLSVLFLHSWYMLSATLFRRHPFLIGTLIYAVASQVLGMVMMFSLNMFDFVNGATSPALMLESIKDWVWASNAVSAAIIAAFYVLSYRRMKRVQL